MPSALLRVRGGVLDTHSGGAAECNIDWTPVLILTLNLSIFTWNCSFSLLSKKDNCFSEFYTCFGCGANTGVTGAVRILDTFHDRPMFGHSFQWSRWELSIYMAEHISGEKKSMYGNPRFSFKPRTCVWHSLKRFFSVYFNFTDCNPHHINPFKH